MAAQFSDESALEVCIHVMCYTNRRLYFFYFTILLGDIMVRASDMRTSGCGFDSQPSHYKAGQVNRVLTCLAGVNTRHVHSCWVANTV